MSNIPGAALDVAIAHLREGVQVIGFDWTYRYLNQTAAEHARRPALELVGRTMSECFPGIEHTDMFAAQKLESLGRLTAGVAHDFNNLLTAILGYSELALEQPMSDALSEDIREIHKAGQRASRLTRQLLAFSRRQSSAPEVVHLTSTAPPTSAPP